MRTPILAVGILALFGAVQPASAQMCGGGQQQAQTSTPGMGGMMCGGTGQAAASDPMTDNRTPSQQGAKSGMCPCCRNMAMMRGGQMGGGMNHDNMPGMEMPKPNQQ
jgi:hypothetical protein